MARRNRVQRRGWFFIIPAVIIGLCTAFMFSGMYGPVDRMVFQLLPRFTDGDGDPVKIIGIETESLDPMDLGKGLITAAEFGTQAAVLALRLETVSGTAVSDDALFLAGAVRYAENVYVPVYPVYDMEEAPPLLPDELKEGVQVSFGLTEITVKGEARRSHDAFTVFSVPATASASAGGFLPLTEKEDIDPRKISLIRKIGGQYYPHLLFSVLLDYVDNPPVYLYADRIVLENANIPGGEMKNILIPLSESGEMYVEGRELSAVSGVKLSEYFDLTAGLGEIIAELHGITGAPEVEAISAVYREAESRRTALMTGSAAGTVEEIAGLRQRFLREAGNYLLSDGEENLVREQPEAAAAISLLFDTGRQVHKRTIGIREQLSPQLDGAICLFFHGDGGTVSRFGSLIPTVTEEAFLDDFPWWYELIAAAVLSFLTIFIVTRFKPLLASLLGLPIALVIAGLPAVPFYLLDYYLPPALPAFAVFAAYIAGVIVQVTVHGKDRRELFLLYQKSVPQAEMDEVAEMLQRTAEAEAGEKFPMAVLATQIADSGDINREFDPSVALSIFNHHTRLVRETILYRNGIIGNTDFDSSWAVWGAFPKDISTAEQAAGTALMVSDRVRESGKGYGVYLGLHFGEVIRGNRLLKGELFLPMAGLPVIQCRKIVRANELYGTRIVMTEKVKSEIKTQYQFRALDKVKVEGTDGPVRLFELIGAGTDFEPDKKEFLDLFQEGHALFEKRDWVRAHKAFIQALKIDGEDKAAKLYARRCQKFAADPPSASWDGSFTIPGV